MHPGTDLKSYLDWEVVENLEELVIWRYRIEDAMRTLKEYKAKLDEHLIFTMKEQGVKEFSTGPEGNRQTIKYGKKMARKVNAKALMQMLCEGTTDEHLAAKSCLSSGQSAWKAAQVELIADSMGREDLVKKEFSEKIEVKVQETDKLKAMGRIG